jgi:hypothetical protein
VDELEDNALRATLMKIIVGSIAAIEHVNRSSEQQRQMFYILDETLAVAEKGDERNHALWMLDEGDFDSFDQAILGHVDETGLYVYQIDEARFRQLVPGIIEHVPIHPECDTFIGVPWLTPRKMGKVKDWRSAAVG